MQSAPGTELHESKALHAQSNMRTKHCRHRAARKQSAADTEQHEDKALQTQII